MHAEVCVHRKVGGQQVKVPFAPLQFRRRRQTYAPQAGLELVLQPAKHGARGPPGGRGARLLLRRRLRRRPGQLSGGPQVLLELREGPKRAGALGREGRVCLLRRGVGEVRGP